MKRFNLKWAIIFPLLITSASFPQSSSITGDNLELEIGKRGKYESQFKNTRTLFTVGSVMTFAGLFCFVSGTSDLVLPLGGTLFSIGHAGLI